MPTFHPIIDGSVRTDGTKAIFILITTPGQRAKVSTGLSVPERLWNAKKREVRVGHRQYDTINKAVQNIVSALQTIYATARGNGIELSASEIKAAYLTPAIVEGKIQFFAFCNEYFDRLEAAGKYNTVRARRSIINKFKIWMGVSDCDFAMITPMLIEKYISYLKSVNGQSTVHVNIKRIKEQFLRANRLGVHVGNPFINIKVSGAKANRAKLTTDEMKAIEQLPSTLAGDLWLFSFYCAGIRFGDMCTLRPSDVRGGVLKYAMSKTGHVREIKLHEKAVAIMERYKGGKWMFPVLGDDLFGLKPTPENNTRIKRSIGSRNVIINRDLKIIADLAGIDKRLTFHVSRHTFADIARKKKLPVQVTSELLGHTSIAITQQYFGSGFDDDTLDDAIRMVVD